MPCQVAPCWNQSRINAAWETSQPPSPPGVGNAIATHVWQTCTHVTLPPTPGPKQTIQAEAHVFIHSRSLALPSTWKASSNNPLSPWSSAGSLSGCSASASRLYLLVTTPLLLLLLVVSRNTASAACSLLSVWCVLGMFLVLPAGGASSAAPQLSRRRHSHTLSLAAGLQLMRAGAAVPLGSCEQQEVAAPGQHRVLDERVRDKADVVQSASSPVAGPIMVRER